MLLYLSVWGARVRYSQIKVSSVSQLTAISLPPPLLSSPLFGQHTCFFPLATPFSPLSASDQFTPPGGVNGGTDEDDEDALPHFVPEGRAMLSRSKSYLLGLAARPIGTDGRSGEEAANSSSTGSSNPATIINNPEAIVAAAYAINGDGGSDGGSDSSGERGAYFRTPLAAKQRLQETQFAAGSKTCSGGGSGGSTSSSSSNDGVTDFSYVQDRGRSKSPP